VLHYADRISGHLPKLASDLRAKYSTHELAQPDADDAAVSFGNQAADQLGMGRLAYWQKRAVVAEEHERRLSAQVCTLMVSIDSDREISRKAQDEVAIGRRDFTAFARPDADETAVEALRSIMVQTADGKREPAIRYIEDARDVLAAIRAGKVPLPEDAPQIAALRSEMETLRGKYGEMLNTCAAQQDLTNRELAAAKELAEKAEYERDVANKYIGHWSQECATARAERDAARAGLAEAVGELTNLRLEVWGQWSLDMGGGWQSDGALSTLEDIADSLVECGALERHPERPWYRVPAIAKRHEAGVGEWKP
jgi:hypothetical protein